MNLRDYGDCEKYQWINTRDCLYSICGYFLIKLIEMLIAKMMMLSLSSSHSTHTHAQNACLACDDINKFRLDSSDWNFNKDRLQCIYAINRLNNMKIL